MKKNLWQSGFGRIMTPRNLLMGGGVAAVLSVVGWFYLTGGRFITTDNAYVKAAKILVTPEVSGVIIAVAVRDNQTVRKGDRLFVIDPAPYRIAVAKAEADLAETRTRIEQLKTQYREKMEDMARAQVEADYAGIEFNRQKVLRGKDAVSQSAFDDVRRRHAATIKSVTVLREEMNGVRAALCGSSDIRPEDHPLVRAAVSVLNKARLDLARTVVLAPSNGIVGAAPRPGDYAQAGVALTNFVNTEEIWIEANYKETELTDVRVGQPVAIEVDTYPAHAWKGRVESISPATGSEFSVLPAQNSTGNWVKVVQRIGVHIAVALRPEDPPLRTGMSAYVTIDTGRYPRLPGLRGG